MNPSLILSCVTRAVGSTVWVFSLFLLFSGHNAPGGGFVGGLVGGAALVLLYATGGVPLLSRALPVAPTVLLGVGLVTAQLTAAAGWLIGGDVLQSRVIDFHHLPVFGDVHVATPLFFDIGVYLVVVGLLAKILVTLGGRDDALAPVSAPGASSDEAAPERTAQ